MTLLENNEKLFYRIGEVSRFSGVKPYVLRYWEMEFKQIRPEKSSSGQRLYRSRDLEIILEIKKLLHDKGYTLAGARKALGNSNPDVNVKQPEKDEKRQLEQAVSELKSIRQMLEG